MAIAAGDFRTGLTLIVDGDPWVVLDFQHVKPGKGAAILKTKMKNLKADSTYYFMDMETYDTYELSEEQIGFNKYFIVEGREASLMFFEGDLLSVSIPEKVELTVAKTDPAIKGAPSNQTKDAVTNTGLTLRVPQFIEEGEEIVVFSSDGKYAGRA